MSETQLIIQGLSRIEFLSLQEEFKKKDITLTNLSEEEVAKAGKQYAFITTAIVVLSVSKMGLDIFKLWWNNRKRRKQSSKPALSLVLPQGAVISFHEDGSAQIRLPGSDQPILVKGELKAEELPGENLQSASEILGDIKDLLKDLDE